jgi:hypothetical protein
MYSFTAIWDVGMTVFSSMQHFIHQPSLIFWGKAKCKPSIYKTSGMSSAALIAICPA